jgi:antitoxin YefM
MPASVSQPPSCGDSWQETTYLLRSPENARRLMAAVSRDKSDQAGVAKTMEELRALAGE